MSGPMSRGLFLVGLLSLGLAVSASPAAAQSVPLTVTGVPEFTEPLSSYSVTVSIPAQTVPVNACVRSNRSDVQMTPGQFSFAPGETSKVVTLTTGPGGQAAIGGLASLASLPDGCGILNPVFTWVRFRLSVNVPGMTRMGSSRTVSVSVMSTSIPQPITVTLSASGAGAEGTTLSPSVLTLAAGQSNAQFTIIPGRTQGDLVISATPSGAGLPYVTGVVTGTTPVGGAIGLQGLTANSIPAGGSQTFNIGLLGGNPPFSATTPFTVTAHVSSSLAISGAPATLTFQPGDLTRPLTLSAPSTLGDFTLSFATTSPYVATTAQYSLKVRGLLTFENKPIALAPGQTSAPITVRLSHPSPTAFSAPITLSGNAGATATPLSFSAGATTATFTITAGAGSSTLNVNVVPDQATSYFRPASFVLPVTTATVTPAGLGVTITPAPEGNAPAATLTFQEVINGGITRLIAITSPLAPPSGYEVPGTPLYFAIQSTALLSGEITACVSYADAQTTDPSELRLFRWVNPGPWLNVTESLNTGTQQICGTAQAGQNAPNTVQWAIFRPNTPPTVSVITGAELVAANTASTFTAKVHDVDDDDELTATWIWGDGTTSPATITNNVTHGIASGEHAWSTGGTKQVTLVVTDGANTVSSEVFIVTVDAAPPSINSLTATPGFVWPPDNKMHAIELTVDATDDSGAVPVCVITGVTEASASKQAEYSLTGPLSASIKAHPHSAYTFTVTCSDAANRTSTKTVTVKIEHVK